MTEYTFTQDQLDALERYGTVVSNLFPNSEGFNEYVADRISEYEYGSVLLNNMNTNKFDEWAIQSYNGASNLENFSNWVGTTTGISSALALDASRMLKPADTNAYFLRYDYVTKGFVESGEAFSHYTFKNLAKAIGVATLPVVSALTAATIIDYIEQERTEEAAKVAAKFGASAAIGTAAVFFTPPGWYALGATAVAGGLSWVADKIIDNIWDDVWDRIQNEEETIEDVLEAYEPESADFIDDILGDLPDGIDTPFGELASPPLPDHKPLPAWTPGVTEPFTDGKTASPLVLDLDGDGVELIAFGDNGAVYWDIDEDGMAEASAWVGADDGLLAIDLNEDGIINDNGELFGNQSGAANGFETLAAYDSNEDDHITDADDDWELILVWIDANSDGYSEETELHTLDELLITDIDLDYTPVSYQIAGNDILQESSFTIDGQTRDIVDAWFDYDGVNTVYNGDYELDVRTLFLPILRGFGNLPDLHIAMSLNEELLDMVAALATTEAADLFSPAAMDDVRAVLYEWAGVSEVSPTSRGVHFDAQKLGFLEALMGEDFLMWGTDPNPNLYAAYFLNEAWNHAFDEISARLLAQTAAGDIFDEAPSYDPLTDTFEGGSLALDFTVLGDVLDGVDPGGARIILEWINIASVIDRVADGLGNLSGGDQTDLDTLIQATSDHGALTFSNIESALANKYNYYFTGTSGDDLILSTGSENYFNSLSGYAGNDILIGGTGKDNLYGGDGDDIYMFSPGFGAYASAGADYIGEDASEGTDAIYITGDLTPDDISFWTASSGYFYLSFNASADDVAYGVAGTDSDGTTIGSYIEYVVFESGITWNLTEGLTLSGDSTGQTIYGAGGNDTIHGNGGNDGLYAYGGNDTLYGDGGWDSMYGGEGDDTYVFGEGFGAYTISAADYIGEYASEGTDTIYIAGELTPDDVSIYALSSGYFYLQIDGNADDIAYGIAGTDGSGTTMASYIESIVFENGPTWDLTAGLHWRDTDDAHSVYGAGTDDVIDARGGSDALYAYGGNDVLYGGGGEDYLYGGDGADTFVFEVASAFSDLDRVQDFNAGDDDALDISDLLVGFTPGVSNIDNFVTLSESAGSTTIAVDRDGTGGTYNSANVTLLWGVTGLVDASDMLAGGNLIAA